MRITHKVAAAATGRSKPHEMRDRAGHSLRINPGGRKTWIVRYRNREGKQRRAKLGIFPTMSAEAARIAGRKVLVQIEAGIDPVEERATARANSVADLCRWYLREYAVTEGLAKSTIRADRYRLETHVLGREPDAQGKNARAGRPWFATMAARSVSQKHIEQIQTEMRATPGGFRRLFTVLRVCFRHAERTGLRRAESNPCCPRTRQRRDGIKLAKDRLMERFLSPTERSWLEAGLVRAEASTPCTRGYIAPGYVLAIRLLAATGMRKGEVVDIALWGHVDWENRFLRLPASKTGAKDVPLSEHALALLRSAYQGQPRDACICVGENGNRLENLQRVWERLRKDVGLEGVRLHDLRHSWASDAIRSGAPIQIVARVLGHASPLTTARYVHLADEYLRESVDRVGAAIAEAAGGVPDAPLH